jgi:hypothetical protein
MAQLAVPVVAVQLMQTVEQLLDSVALEILHPQAQAKVTMAVLQQQHQHTVVAVAVALVQLVQLD